MKRFFIPGSQRELYKMKDHGRTNNRDIETVLCKTTKGDVTVQVHKDWAPNGSKRFLDLVGRGYYDGVGLFRKNRWIIQFGAVKHPQTGWRKQFSGMKPILDDPKTNCNGKCVKGRLWDGALAFAGGGKDSRSDQIFFVHHLGHQPIGNELWETPIGNVSHGMDVLKQVYETGESVNQVKIFQHGDEYLKTFKELDYILGCSILKKTELRGAVTGTATAGDLLVPIPILEILPQVGLYVCLTILCLVSMCLFAVRARMRFRKKV